MMFPRLTVLAALLGVAFADLQITNPGADHWWVAKSINTLAWTCADTTHPTFTVLIGNSDPKVLTQPQAFIAIQNNFDCSKTITETQSDRAPGTGYTILLADPLNNTNVFATSEPFEIKAFGSAYPTSASSSSPSATDSSSGTGSSPSPTGQGGAAQPNGAGGLKTAFTGIYAFAVAAVGLAFA